MNCHCSWRRHKYTIFRSTSKGGGFAHNDLRDWLTTRELKRERLKDAERLVKLAMHRKWVAHARMRDYMTRCVAELRASVFWAEAVHSHNFAEGGPIGPIGIRENGGYVVGTFESARRVLEENRAWIQRFSEHIKIFPRKAFFWMGYSGWESDTQLDMVSPEIREAYMAFARRYSECAEVIYVYNGGGEDVVWKTVGTALSRLDEEVSKLTALLDGLEGDHLGYPIGKGVNVLSKQRVTCAHEGCRGPCDDGKCCKCGQKTCVACRDIAHEGPCNQETLDNVNAIIASCTQCPTCAEFIYKRDGCDLGWCTSCHAFFSFETGQPMRSGHNPECHEHFKRLGHRMPEPDEDAALPLNPIERNHYITHSHASKAERHVLASYHNTVIEICNREEYSAESLNRCLPDTGFGWSLFVDRQRGFLNYERERAEISRHRKFRNRIEFTNLEILTPLRTRTFKAIDGFLTHRLNYDQATEELKSAASDFNREITAVASQWKACVYIVGEGEIRKPVYYTAKKPLNM